MKQIALMGLVALLAFGASGCGGCGPVVVEVGGGCEKQADCDEGLWCLGRVCRTLPGETKDGGPGPVADAGTDAGLDGDGDIGAHDAGTDASSDAALDAEVDDGGDAADAVDAGSPDACGGQISLKAYPTSVPAKADKTVRLTATLRYCDAVKVPDGTEVTIAVTGPIGSDTVVVPTVGEMVSTDYSGGTTPGIVTVTASFVASGGVTLSDTITFELTEPKCGPSMGTANIVLTATPNTVPADGSHTIALAATATGCDQKPVPDGTEVRFYASDGTFIGSTPTNTASGKAETLLRSSTTPGTATVRAAFYNEDIEEITATVYVHFILGAGCGPSPTGKGGDMCDVPAGPFMMGCNTAVDAECDSNENPYHAVNVPEFKIDKYEVTASEYKACVTDSVCTAANTPSGCNYIVSGKESHPINCVDWTQAKAYCAWAGKRLPTEAEWEKAARVTDGRKYPWGNAALDCNRAVHSGSPCSNSGTATVGSKPTGVSPYGAADMIGNVWEWVEDDWRGTYTSAPSDGNAWVDAPRRASRVVRGGSWYSTSSSFLRASYRNYEDPSIRNYVIGFRCGSSAQ